MIADDETAIAIRALVDRTYDGMSTPGSDVGELFTADDIAIAGSGQGELWAGPDQAVAVAKAVASQGLKWTADKVTVWRRDDVAWAQILGSVHVVRDDINEVVPYLTTGVFQFEDDRWQWVYWGGSEPQESAKV